MEQIKQLKQEISHIENNIRIFADGLTGDAIADNYYQCAQIPVFEEELRFAQAELLDAYMSNPLISNMLKIAELQVMLIELGFEFLAHSKYSTNYNHIMRSSNNFIEVSFFNSLIVITDYFDNLFQFTINSPTWSEDALTKIKLLITSKQTS